MASAKRIPQELDQRDVQLTLTAFEASVLTFICTRIGGTPGEHTPRGAMDSIAGALFDAHVSAGHFKTDASRSIHFTEETSK